MGYTSMFDERLIFLDVEGEDLKELFEEIAKRLQEQGFVNEQYVEGLLAREQAFPTGLITQYLNIGLPHSEPAYRACHWQPRRLHSPRRYWDNPALPAP